MASGSFTPKEYLQKIIHYWWILFLAVAVGGALGVGLSLMQTPMYEAAARISTSIDYTILPELEDYEEDRIINEAGWVMLSDEVLEVVAQQAAKSGISISIDTLENNFSADRIDDLWSLRVVSDDPATATALADLWVDEAFTQLDTAHGSALEAQAIRESMDVLTACLDEISAASATLPLCEAENSAALQSALEVQAEDLEQALKGSRGLNPASVYTLTSYAQTPNSPVVRARGVMALAGMLLGLTGGMILIWFVGKKVQ